MYYCLILHNVASSAKTQKSLWWPWCFFWPIQGLKYFLFIEACRHGQICRIPRIRKAKDGSFSAHCIVRGLMTVGVESPHYSFGRRLLKGQFYKQVDSRRR